jgi:hypothetical protein
MAEVRVYQPGKSGLQQANKAKLQQNSPNISWAIFVRSTIKRRLCNELADLR